MQYREEGIVCLRKFIVFFPPKKEEKFNVRGDEFKFVRSDVCVFPSLSIYELPSTAQLCCVFSLVLRLCYSLLDGLMVKSILRGSWFYSYELFDWALTLQLIAILVLPE
jgi:hypothetical protein